MSEGAANGNNRDTSEVTDYDTEEEEETFNAPAASTMGDLEQGEPAFTPSTAPATPKFTVPPHLPDGHVVDAKNTLRAHSLAAMSGAATAGRGEDVATMTTTEAASAFPPGDTAAFYKRIQYDSGRAIPADSSIRDTPHGMKREHAAPPRSPDSQQPNDSPLLAQSSPTAKNAATSDEGNFYKRLHGMSDDSLDSDDAVSHLNASVIVATRQQRREVLLSEEANSVQLVPAWHFDSLQRDLEGERISRTETPVDTMELQEAVRNTAFCRSKATQIVLVGFMLVLASAVIGSICRSEHCSLHTSNSNKKSDSNSKPPTTSTMATQHSILLPRMGLLPSHPLQSYTKLLMTT
jgi:hypothetical protein